jgi:hypothetical protein
MRKIVLSAVFALGMGLAASTGASAAPLAAGLNGLSTAPNASMIEQVQWRRHCRTDRVCRRGPYGRRHCVVRRVCR